jgi:hypothetical protein
MDQKEEGERGEVTPICSGRLRRTRMYAHQYLSKRSENRILYQIKQSISDFRDVSSEMSAFFHHSRESLLTRLTPTILSQRYDICKLPERLCGQR